MSETNMKKVDYIKITSFHFFFFYSLGFIFPFIFSLVFILFIHRKASAL